MVDFSPHLYQKIDLLYFTTKDFKLNKNLAFIVDTTKTSNLGFQTKT